MADLTTTVVSIAKWILTSLLAINGGAAIAAWQIDMDATVKVAACAAFVAGVLLALLCGHIQVRNAQTILKPLGAAVGYWISVQADGFRVAELEDTTEMEAVADRSAKLPTAIGWLSVLAFVVGTALAGYGGLYHDARVNSPPAAQAPGPGASPQPS